MLRNYNVIHKNSVSYIKKISIGSYCIYFCAQIILLIQISYHKYKKSIQNTNHTRVLSSDNKKIIVESINSTFSIIEIIILILNVLWFISLQSSFFNLYYCISENNDLTISQLIILIAGIIGFISSFILKFTISQNHYNVFSWIIFIDIITLLIFFGGLNNSFALSYMLFLIIIGCFDSICYTILTNKEFNIVLIYIYALMVCYYLFNINYQVIIGEYEKFQSYLTDYHQNKQFISEEFLLEYKNKLQNQINQATDIKSNNKTNNQFIEEDLNSYKNIFNNFNDDILTKYLNKQSQQIDLISKKSDISKYIKNNEKIPIIEQYQYLNQEHIKTSTNVDTYHHIYDFKPISTPYTWPEYISYEANTLNNLGNLLEKKEDFNKYELGFTYKDYIINTFTKKIYKKSKLYIDYDQKLSIIYNTNHQVLEHNNRIFNDFMEIHNLEGSFLYGAPIIKDNIIINKNNNILFHKSPNYYIKLKPIQDIQIKDIITHLPLHIHKNDYIQLYKNGIQIHYKKNLLIHKLYQSKSHNHSFGNQIFWSNMTPDNTVYQKIKNIEPIKTINIGPFIIENNSITLIE